MSRTSSCASLDPCARQDFLSPAEVDALNASFDANWERRDLGAENAKRHAIDQFRGMLGWPSHGR
jgi:hypothetical protein